MTEKTIGRISKSFKNMQFFTNMRLTKDKNNHDIGPDSVMVRASASEAGGRGFESGPRHTKDVKNGASGYLAWHSAFIRLALASLLPKR